MKYIVMSNPFLVVVSSFYALFQCTFCKGVAYYFPGRGNSKSYLYRPKFASLKIQCGFLVLPSGVSTV